MDQANPQGGTLLQQGIAAARAKRKGEAYQLLRQVVTTDPRNSEAWLWLGGVAPTLQEQMQAFERVLALDPTNERAQAGRRWAASRLGEGAAPAPPPAPASGSGISSQDMLNMFGSVPGATRSPPPAASPSGFSSQDMLGMFGTAPGTPTPARPELPPPPASSSANSRGSTDLRGTFNPPAPSLAPPSADNDLFARQPGNDFDLSTPQPFDASMFGAAPPVLPSPPSSPLPPGAPGTPGGAEWRGYSDLQEPEASNWDDSGEGLRMGTPAPTAPAFSSAGMGTAPRASNTYDPSPSLFSDLDRDVADTRPAAFAPADTMLPPQPQAERRGVPALVILGAVVLIVLLLLSGILSALTANKTITLGAVAGPEDAVRGFLTAHVRGLSTEAASYLVPALANDYRQADSALRTGLPDPRQVRGLAARVAPLAATDTTAEVYGFFTATVTPAPTTFNPNPWTFTLEKRDTGWLITGITPP